MRTLFTPAQRGDPDIEVCEHELRRCVHCGFCTATCPTYVLDGNELDSPRGRIGLIQRMLEEGGAPDPAAVVHIDRCLSCLACETTCPSGVRYARLVDEARAHIARHHKRPWLDRLTRWALGRVMPDPGWFERTLTAGRLARPLAAVMPARLKPMLDLVPANATAPRPARVGVHKAVGPTRLRVALLVGCVQDSLRPTIHDATVRVLTKLGCEVIVPAEAGCCGSLNHHLGQEEAARRHARRTLEAWCDLLVHPGLDHVVVDTSGCGSTVKDYGHVFRNDPDLAQPAETIAQRTLDVSELVARLAPAHLSAPRPLVLAYQSACSLQHAQKVSREPVELLARAGYVVRTLEDAHLCCGSAGTYNLLQSDFAARLRALKVAAIERTGADAVASGNIGCIMHLATAVDRPVAHTIEWLDWALGGPAPPGVATQDKKEP